MQTPAARAVDLGAVALAKDANGVPRLMRGTPSGPALPAATATASALAHVTRLAPAWGVQAAPQLVGIGEIAMPGGTVVRIQQMLAGMPIEASAGGELRAMVRKDGKLVAASGQMFSSAMPRASTNFVDSNAGAVARAVRALYKGKDFQPAALTTKATSSAGVPFFAGASGDIHVSMSRAQKAWWPEGKQMTAVWVVEMYSGDAKSTDSDAYRTVISADGRVLKQTDLKADVAFRYRVFAETTGEFHVFDGPIEDAVPNPTGVPSTIPFPNTPYPNFVAPNLVTVDGTNHPGGGTVPDPWMKANATQTIGNNAEAYTDLNAPDGLTIGDFRALVSSNRTFDRTYDFTKSATADVNQQMAGITSLFYILNWMHDFWYDGGFTEAAGNGQNSNLGRGGADGDAMLGEAQDNANGGSRNNANMSTPADGFAGRMQVFVWDNKDNERFAKISGGANLLAGTASFVPTTFDVTASVVVANDGVTTPAPGSVTDACSALNPADVTGKIVLVDRGGCSFKFKARSVQLAGGVGMLLANNAPNQAPPGLGNDATITDTITIPVLSLSLEDGNAIKTAIAGGPQTAQLKRVPGPDLDGSLDASVLAHEFGHFLHHRLSNCNTALCGAMSEGWGDFSALLVVTREEDRTNNKLDGAYPMGVFSTRSFLADPTYFGIRRAPYSTDPAINGFTFKHMTQGQALPTTFPISGGNVATNNEVHAAGEVWANTMWEGYVALQKSGAARSLSFDEMRLRMRKYIVGGLLLAPTDNTPTEMRDAILAVAFDADPADHDALAAAYAEHGLGTCAVSPDRNSVTFTGITESFEVKGRLDPGVVTVEKELSCDEDSILDAGETAKFKVHVANGGPGALTGVSAELTTAVTGITIANPTIAIGNLDKYGDADVAFEVSLADNVNTVVAGDFTVTLHSAGGCTDTAVTPISIPLNSDDKNASSATDSFSAVGTPWVIDTAPTTLWSHDRQSALEGRIHGIDDGSNASDGSITSPVLIAGNDPVSLKFKHRFSFEGSVTNAFDGGVIEFSTLDAPTVWKDIAEIAATNPYNAVLVAGGTNALAGRPAFGGKSTGFDAGTFQDVTIDLGTALAGKMFKIRFHVGSDANTGAPGWDLDDVGLTGLTNTPFPTLIADEGECQVITPDAAPDAPPDAAPDAPVVYPDAAPDAPPPPVDAAPDAPPVYPDAATPDAAPPAPDAYTPPRPDAGPTHPGGGGGCSTSSNVSSGSAILAFLTLGSVLRRRRRK